MIEHTKIEMIVGTEIQGLKHQHPRVKLVVCFNLYIYT